MIEEELRRKIGDFRELGIPAYVPRAGEVHLVDRMVSTIVGARRAGKSFRALQVGAELIRSGELRTHEQICPIDFDNPILSVMKATELKTIESTFLQVTPEAGLTTPLVFIFDELHKIEGWEQYVVDLSRNASWRVVVTGSSSRLLRDEIATELRGKAVSSVVYPLSFSEFLTFHGVDSGARSTKNQSDIRRLFETYLKWGGYPALVGQPDRTKEALLREYFDTMILKDVIQRYDVSKPSQCIELYHYLLSIIGKPHTLQSAHGLLKQRGHATSRDAVRDYVRWAKDSWLLFTVPIQTDSPKQQDRNYKKVYCVDWGLAVHNSTVWDGSYSRALENLVYVELLRRYPRVRYYLTRAKRQEVDFLVSDNHAKPVLAIQVCTDPRIDETLRRELEPLFATARFFGTERNLILTLNHEARYEQEGVTVHAIPAWKWLLDG